MYIVPMYIVATILAHSVVHLYVGDLEKTTKTSICVLPTGVETMTLQVLVGCSNH